MASFTLQVSRDIDLASDMLAISINQQGERLQTYRNTTEDKFEPARFNIMLIHTPVQGPARVIKCENSAWLQSSLVLHMVDGVESLPKGSYTIVLMALWNQIALDNPDYQRILIKVHSPCPTNIIEQNAGMGLKAL